ncbi:hypothetical protein AVEN_265980-1 [Araneus ventricosus]|uniref:Uncharacterized protein n=1 Tax=Araneus ventricosus TaxID=182803 RepID=A0A4Y2GJW2_ARAVE|nr:hypothetical protein AVEN_265980-1 [Araneus ventricosus]
MASEGKGEFCFVSRRRDLNNHLKVLKQACNKSLGKSYGKPCFLLTSEPFRYLAEMFNPCHGKLCDNPLPLLTTRFPKPFRQAFFVIWACHDKLDATNLQRNSCKVT